MALNSLRQNIEPQDLSSCHPISTYTAFALAMFCFRNTPRKDLDHIGAGEM